MSEESSEWWPHFDPPSPYVPAELPMETLAHLAYRLLIHQETCKCGGVLRGTFNSNDRDSNPFPHQHRFWVWCPDCQRSQSRVLYHQGHQPTDGQEGA